MGSRMRDDGLADARNREFMALGYPPGPTKEAAKKLDLRDVRTFARLHADFGPIYMLPLGDKPLVVTCNAEHIAELLGGAATESFPRPQNVKDNVKLLFGTAQIALDGTHHQANKRALSSFLFSEAHNSVLAVPFAEVMGDFITRLEDDFARQGAVDAYAVASLAAVDLSALLSFGRTYRALALGYCPQLEALQKCDDIFLARAMNKRWKETERPETTAAFESNKALIAQTFEDAFASIKAGDDVQPNVVKYFLDTQKRNNANAGVGASACPVYVPPEDDIKSNLVGFLAGVGNTARMLASTVELMAQRPGDQERVLAELHSVLGGKSAGAAAAAARDGEAVPGSRNAGLFTYEAIMRLDFLHAFMFECLRLFPPSTSVAPRQCSVDSKLGGFVIPSGTTVMVNFYSSHRDPGSWEDPDEFRPERFLSADGSFVLPIGTHYTPFGYGGHSCIGKNLAQLASLMMLACLLSNHRVFKAEGQPDAVFGTTNSVQILGFIEPLSGSDVSLQALRRDAAADAAADAAVAAATPERERRAEAAVDAARRDLEAEAEAKAKAKAKATATATATATASAKDTAGSKDGSPSVSAAASRVITMEEVQRHVTPEDGVWFVMESKVYDVTPWLAHHPGGPAVLQRVAGKDATHIFFNVTKHSTFAIEEAQKYQIGVLAPASTAKL